jgi:hypothetical protein
VGPSGSSGHWGAQRFWVVEIGGKGGKRLLEGTEKLVVDHGWMLILITRF